MFAANRTILHVDDSALIREMVADHFTQLGYNVISIADPTEVMTALLVNNCQVVISDIQMEPVDGLTLLQQIKKDDGGVSVIMLSGLIGTNTILRSMRWGAEACIFKPLNDFTRLERAVAAVFKKHEEWWMSLQEAHVKNRSTAPGNDVAASASNQA
ncbi:response regulator [Bremerella cremea]|uniref:response regulator n=1 Tax=Bremerella cremea TaxID=1031537 RepID=UPI0031E77966